MTSATPGIQARFLSGTRWYQSPWAQSFGLHLLVIILALLLVFRPQFQFAPKKVELEVIEFPKHAPQETLKLQPKALPKPAAPPQKAVFGVSRKAITTDSALPGAGVKLGNTVAKEQDNLKLEVDDPTSLPIPTDDYLVSKMPSLAKEIRIPYPEEARKANAEGPVVMDLLIDDSGKVRKVELVKGPGFGLNEAAVTAAYQFEFKPAVMNDKAVAVKIRYTYRFVLETR